MRSLTGLMLLCVSCTASPPRTEAIMRDQRLACAFAAGAMPKDTLGEDVRLGDKMPIDHIVLLMQENRSFDHYFSRLEGVRTVGDDLQLTGTDGQPLQRAHETRYCVDDISHNWNAAHRQWNGGANDGFGRVPGKNDPARALAYYDERDIPYYYALARTFAVSDMHFASLLGGTWPNRMFYLAGSSYGVIRNTIAPAEDARGNPVRTIFEALDSNGIDFRVYVRADAPSMLLFLPTYGRYADRVVPMDRYFSDLADGTLPPFAMVEPAFIGQHQNDEHAPTNIQYGQQFTSTAINALIASPLWRRSALFLSYDENGGFYDSVPPPPACAPDDAPDLEPTSEPGVFDRLGFRVPMIVVSPFARRGFVSHRVTDHTSLLRFVEARFSLPAFTARDANAEAPFEMFDFEHPEYDVPALPEAVVDPAADAACKARR